MVKGRIYVPVPGVRVVDLHKTHEPPQRIPPPRWLCVNFSFPTSRVPADGWSGSFSRSCCYLDNSELFRYCIPCSFAFAIGYWSIISTEGYTNIAGVCIVSGGRKNRPVIGYSEGNLGSRVTSHHPANAGFFCRGIWWLVKAFETAAGAIRHMRGSTG